MSILNLRALTVDPAFAVSGSDSLIFTADVAGPLSVVAGVRRVDAGGLRGCDPADQSASQPDDRDGADTGQTS